MKEGTPFLSALLLLLLATSLLAQDNENSVSILLNAGNNNEELTPRRDPEQGSPDWITYDDGEPKGLVQEFEDYFSRVIFTPEYNFELHSIQFMVLNDGPNNRAPCYVWVLTEDQDHNLCDKLFETRINEIKEWDRDNLQNNWINVEIPEDRWVKFEQGESFNIIYGPAPGGRREGEPREGDGWWNFYDRDHDSGSSFIARELSDDHRDWTEYNDLVQGDLLLRAGGVYDSDNTAPAWDEEPPEEITVNEGERIAFRVYGIDEDDNEELVIEYETNNIPEDAHFEYEMYTANRVVGTFEWETDYDDEGKYEAAFILTDGKEKVETVVQIAINDANCPPEWGNVPEAIEVNEEAAIAFWVIGRDFDGDRLSIEYRSEDLPREVYFRDYGYGRGLFSWRTTDADAGDYTAEFIITDGSEEVSVEVPITVIDTNRPPEWTQVPEKNYARGFVGEELTFVLAADDPENDELEFAWDFIESPDNKADARIHVDHNEVLFEMEPEAGQHGTYVAIFAVSDGNSEVTVQITIEILSDHYQYVRSGLPHTIVFESIYYFGETLEWEEDENNLDEIAILTEHDQVAGAYRFNGTNDRIYDRDRYRREEGFIFTAWGDNPNTQPVEGFRQDERFYFQYWDSDARETYNTVFKIAAGNEAWRRDGYSVVALYVGPILAVSPRTIDFNQVEIDNGAERTLTLRSIGTTSIENLELSIDNEVFTVNDNEPIDMAVDARRTVTILFSPSEPGHYNATLTASNDFIEETVQLSGIGIQTGYFEYTITEMSHHIEVVRAVLDDENLSEDDEIGVFTEGGLCSGALIIRDNAEMAFNAWGDNPETGDREGFRDDEHFSFKFWDNDAEREYNAISTFLYGPDTWQDGESTIVALYSNDRHFNWIETEESHIINVEEVDLREGDEIAVITPRGTVAGAVTVGEERPYTIQAFGDDSETNNIIEGFQEGERIYFRVWMRERDEVYLARFEWEEGPERWENRAESVVNLKPDNRNREPYWRQPRDTKGAEGETLEFAVVATDPDRDPISLLLNRENLPDNIQFTDRGNGAGIFTWTPDYDQAGEYALTFIAFDGWDAVEMRMQIGIENANQPPVLAEIGAIEIDEEERYSLQLSAEDPDGNRLCFSFSGEIRGASLEKNLFRWTPSSNQAGEYQVTFRVTDYGQPPRYDEETVTITVNNINQPPEWCEAKDVEATEGERVVFGVRAYDEDDRNMRNREGNLSLSAIDLPEGAEFTDRGRGRGIFNWQTDLQSSGEYYPRFIAFDGDERDTLTVNVIIYNRNQSPELEDIEDQRVTVGDTLRLEVYAHDPDEGDQAELELIAQGLPYGATFEDQGEGHGLLVWAPRYDRRGMYGRVTFLAIDPDGGRDAAMVTFTAIVDDREPPVITIIQPDSGEVIRYNRVKLGAGIVDEISEIREVELTFDNEHCEGDWSERYNVFSWGSDELSEGIHRFSIRAVDSYRNIAVKNSWFVVDSDAGVIEVDEELPEYTRREAINITGYAEPCLNLELYRNKRRVMQGEAGEDGSFIFERVELSARNNVFDIVGGDSVGNIADPVRFAVYLDLVPPEIEFISTWEYSDGRDVRILATVIDRGCGVEAGDVYNRRRNQGVLVTLDGERVEAGRDFVFEDDTLDYRYDDRDEHLTAGTHILGISAVDRLGNATEEPILFRFFIDYERPVIEHRFLDDEEVEVIGNIRPRFTIPVADPMPGSGINEESIRFGLDGEWYDVEWSEREGSIYFESEELAQGGHEMRVVVRDLAGNLASARGSFRIDRRVADRNPPFFENLYPPPGGVAGRGLREREGGGANADTVSFVIGDEDIGVNNESIWMMIVALNNPRDPRDNDTTYIGRRRMLISAGHVSVPMRNNAVDINRDDPNEMPGLEEGFNEVNVFGADEDDNDGEEQWQFFFDDTPPEPPEVDEPESEYYNTTEFTLTGSVGGDEPNYEDNEAYINIYLGDSLVVESAVEWESDFEVSGVELVEGWNEIYAVVLDGGGNPSDNSDTLSVFLDLTEPATEEFEAVDGAYLATETPSFTATLTDVGSGLDTDNINLTIGELEVAVSFDKEEDLMTAQISEDDALANGDYTAQLIVYDIAGNVDTTEFDFNIDLDPVDPPQIVSFETYTSTNQISLSGEGIANTYIRGYLDDENVGEEVSLGESTEFVFEYTAVSLDDTTYVDITARNRAGTESDHTDAEMLIVDSDAPVFSNETPSNGTIVDAGTLEEISVLVSDAISGIESNSAEFLFDGNPFDFEITETESGYLITADVSEFEFTDEQLIEVVATINDRSDPANEGALSWEFIANINDAPAITLPDTSFNEDETLTIDLSDYAEDEDNGFDELTFTAELIVGDENAVVEIDHEEGLLHINADDNWFGDLRIVVEVEDTLSATGSDTFDIVVVNVNDAPVFESVPADTTIETGTEFQMEFTASDVDPDDELTFDDDTDIFDIDQNGQVSFTPDSEMLGQHVIQFYVTDTDEASDMVEFNLFIVEPNQEVELTTPIDDVAIDEDADPTEIVDLDDVFSDPEEAALNYTIEYSQEGILLDIDEETSVLTLSPDLDFNGEVEVTIYADDLAGSEISDIFTVTVNPVNDAPLQVGLLPELVLTTEDAGRTVIADLDTVFTDVEDNELNFDCSGGDHLGVDIDEDLLLSINPDEDWNGEEAFTLSADDGVESARLMGNFGQSPGRDDTSELEISVEVEAVNDAPRIAVDDPFTVEMDEDQEPLTIETAIADLFNDPDQGDVVTVSWDDDPDGIIELSLDDNEEYIIASIVTENFNGNHDYEITATDLDGEETGLTLTFSINAVNDPPEVTQSIEDIEIDEDANPRHVEIASLGSIFNDVDGDELEYSIEGAPAQLNIGIDEDNILYVEPDDNYNIPNGVEITVFAEDGIAEQVGAGLDVSFRFGESAAIRDTGPVRALRSVGEAGSSKSFETSTERGLRSFNSGNPGFEPNRDDEIDNSFELTIHPSNDDPYWEETSAQETDEMQTLEFLVTADDPDLEYEGDDLTLTIIDDDDLTDLSAEFTDNGDGTGTFTWQPGYDDSGEYNPVFRVTDSNEAYDDMPVTISVNHVNREPVWDDLPEDVEIAEEEELELTVEGSDPDGDAVSLSAESDDLPEGWEFTDNEDGTGTFNWTTGFNDEGSYTISFTIADNEFEVTAEVIVSVGDVNRPPVWDDVPANESVYEDATLSFTVQGSDPDEDDVSFTADSEDLPEGWEFMDNDNGTADFTWTTGYDDAGEYTLALTVSDDEFNIDAEVVITVNNTNRTPVWDNIPEAEEVDENQQLQFVVESSDPDDDALSIDASSQDLPEGWEFNDNEDGTGTFTWTPSYDDAGSYTLTLNLTDGDFEVDPDVTITVNNVNRVPGLIEVPDQFVTDENEALEFTIEGDDPDGDDITIDAASDDLPQGWEFTDNENGTGDFNWTPSYNQAGEYAITFTVSDNDLSEEYERTITVNNVNRAPVEGNISDSYEGNEDEQLAFQIGFTDPDGDQIRINASSNELPEGWEFTDNENGMGDFNWTPSYNDAGEYELTFTASDGSLNNTVDVLILVNNINREPVWDYIPDQVEVSEVHALEFDVEASDPDGNSLTITYSSDDIPDNAEFTDNQNGTGSFYWTPTYNDAGEYTALFTLEDDEASVERTVTITVNNVNRAPVISDLNDRNEINVSESDLVEFELSASDPDGDGLSFSFDPGDLPESAELTDNHDGTASFSWQTGYIDAGEYYPLFSASDDDLEGDLEVLIIVGDVNRSPAWEEVVNEISVNENNNCEFTISATDPDGDALTIDAASDDLPYGWDADDNHDGSCSFNWRPSFDDAGEYTVVFTVSDRDFEVETETVIIVSNTNRAPVFSDISQEVETDEMDQLEFIIEASDPDGDNVAISAASDDLPDGWDFTDNDNNTGTFNWTPGYEDSGEYTVTFVISDGSLENQSEVTIHVNHVNRAPAWDDAPENVEVNEDYELEFSVTASDPDGDNLSLEALSENLPEGWNFNDNGNGSGLFTWTPGFEDAGEYTVVFIVSDNDYDIETETVITVNSTNRAPVWEDIPDEFSSNERTEIEFRIEASDPDGNALTIEAASDNIPEGWEFNDNRNGSGRFNWTPGYEDSGDYSVTFSVSDAEFDVDAEVSFTVIHVNRSPIWTDIPNSISAEEEDFVEFAVEGSDPDGDDVTIEMSDRGSLPDQAEFEYNNDGAGVFSWQTNNEDEGSYTVEFTISDGELEETEDVIITVGDVNRPPVWTDIPENTETDENSELSLTIEGSDPDDDDVTIEVTSTNLPEGWEFTDNQNGTAAFSWTPDYFDAGEYYIIFTISDNEFHVARRVDVTVNNVNRSPVFNDAVESVEVNENSRIEFTVEAADPDNEDLTITANSDNLPEGWRFTDNRDGSGTFTWMTNYNSAGEYSVVITATDDDLETDTEVALIVNNVNRTPVWINLDQNIETDENEELTFDIETSDPDGDELTLSGNSEDIPEGWTFEDNEDGTGTFNWTPSYDDAGEYQITFLVTDGGLSSERNVNITVNNVNRTPVWDYVPEDLDVDENSELEFTVEASDPDGDQLTLEASSNDMPEGWEFTDSEDGTGTFNWTPTYDDEGQYTLILNVSDDDLNVGAEIRITVNHVNQAPRWVDIPRSINGAEEDFIEFTVEGSDPDGDDITIEISDRGGLPESAQFEYNDDGTGAFSWQTTNDDGGSYTVEFTLADDEFNVTEEVVISIGDVNRAPVWDNVPERVEVDENSELSFTVEGSDPDGDDVTIETASDDLPDGWDYEDHQDGTATFTWTPGFEDSGEYSATFTISDAEYNCEAAVSITVNDVNRTPAWDDVPETVEFDEDQWIEFTVSGSDPDGDELTITASSEDLPEGWEFTDCEDGSGEFAWKPGFDDSGEYSVLFTVSDGEFDLEAQTEITVNHVNRSPDWEDIVESAEVDEDSELSFTVTGSDPDSDDLTIELTSDNLPDGYEFVDHEDGSATFTWTPTYNDAGEYSALLTLSDGQIAIESELSVTVNHINRSPVWDDEIPESAEVDEDSELSFTVTGSDPDGDNVSIGFTSDNLPEDYEFVDHEDGSATFTWTPTYDDAGEYSALLTLSDGQIEVESGVDITVNNVNRAPEFTDIPEDAEINEDELLEFTIEAEDPDGDDLTIEAVSDDLPDGWEFTDNEDGTGNFAWRSSYDDAGEYHVMFTVSDGELEDECNWLIMVDNVNRRPIWNEPDADEPIRADEGDEIVINISAHDPDSDDISISLTDLGGLPDDIEFEDNQDGTAVLTWQTDFEDEGRYTPTFIVSDGELETEVELTIGVGQVNLEPVWDAPDPDELISCNESEELAFEVIVHDPDEDEVSITITDRGGLPEEAGFTDNHNGTGNFVWETGYEDEGEYHPVFTVSDGTLSIEVTLNLEVVNRNREPVWTEIPEEVVGSEDSVIEFTVEGADPDDNDLTIEASSDDLPEGWQFTDNHNGSGEFSWETNFEHEGEYTLTVALSDGEYNVEADILIIVEGENRPPEVVNPIDDIEIDEDSEETLIADLDEVFDDPDGDMLTYEIITNIENLNLNLDAQSHELYFTPEENYFGENEIVIAADDGNDQQAAMVVRFGAQADDLNGNTITSRSLRNSGRINYINLPPRRDDDVADEFVINILPVNDAPVIADENERAMPDEIDEQITEGEELRIELQAYDIEDDNRELDWSVVDDGDLPDGWELNDNQNGSCVFTWTPSRGDAENAPYNPVFRVTDSEDDVDELTVNIAVEAGEFNDPPVIIEPTEDETYRVTIDEGSRYSLTFTAEDPNEDDNLSWSVIDDGGLPNGWEFIDNEDGSAEFVWTPGYDDEGEYNPRMLVEDGNDHSDAIELVITVDNVNREPVITEPEGDPYRVNIQEDEELRISFNAEDPDEDALTWTVADEDGLPEGWEFTDNENGTAEFVWTPAFEDEGEYNPIFRVSDDDASDEIEVLIAVGNCNRRPEWVDIPEEVELTEGEEVVAVVEAFDPDNDELSLSASSDDLPEGWQFDDNEDNTMTITWTPSFDDAGEYTLTLTASDEEFDVAVDVRIIVRDDNRPPEWTDIPESVEIDENSQLEFSIEGSDPDNDSLSITAESDDLPDGWEFNDNGDGTGDFAWTPSYDDAGEYTVVFTISDGEYNVDAEVVITVNHTNRSPIWVDIPQSVNIVENELLEFTIVGSDPDDDNISIEATTEYLPDGWEFTDNGDGTGDFSWTPGFEDAGNYTATFIISDGEFDAEEDVIITVGNVNRPPEWTDIPESVEIDENELLEFSIVGSDPDVDDLTIELYSDNLPDAVEFIDNGDGTGTFTWTPTYDDAGEYSATFTISDGEAQVETVVDIVVNNVNNIPDEDEALPIEFTLQPVYPNPFNPIASVKFGLPEASDIHLMVWDGSGRLIETVMSEQLPAGWHTVQWSADNLPTGVYIFTLRAGDVNLVTKGVLIR
ncbi:tandem-95 repeat protein [bacterium]|nr:tandem-95 repeat protein [bacterium]